MKRKNIYFYRKGVEIPISVYDDSKEDLVEYSKIFQELFNKTEIVTIQLSSGIVIIPPSSIDFISLEESSDNKLLEKNKSKKSKKSNTQKNYGRNEEVIHDLTDSEKDIENIIEDYNYNDNEKSFPDIILEDEENINCDNIEDNEDEDLNK